ncbi:hypothetical protein D3C73_1562610 [compost metagenome]
MFRVQFAEFDDLVDLSDGGLGSHGHDRAEITGGLAVDQVAPAVTLVRLDQCEVGVQRHFQHVLAAIDLTGFLAF